MSELSDFLETKIIEHFFRGNAQAATTPYVGLFSVMPADDGTGGTEVTTTIRVAGRVAAGFAASSGGSGQVANSADVDFGAAAGGATVVGFGLFDAASGGNLLAYSPLTGGSQAVGAGNTVKFAAGALTITIA
jgi:hypothetical protein